MNDDAELLRAYAKEGSGPAFRQLVERHIPLVQATARRIVAGDLHLAQDVTQTVFTDLARKAATLPAGVVLGGWLHRHTCFTAAKAVRTEQRRRARERTAMEINTVNENTGQDAHWAQLAPVLDDALNSLATDDRDAIVLRYFERRDLRSIGASLGISDDTAQKRIVRALEKLRDILTRRGVTLASATMLSTALDAAVVTSVPTEQAATVSTKAVGSAAATTGFFLTYLLDMTTAKRIALGIVTLIILAGLGFFLHMTRMAPPTANTGVKTIDSIDKLPLKPVNIA